MKKVKKKKPSLSDKNRSYLYSKKTKSDGNYLNGSVAKSKYTSTLTNTTHFASIDAIIAYNMNSQTEK